MAPTNHVVDLCGDDDDDDLQILSEAPRRTQSTSVTPHSKYSKTGRPLQGSASTVATTVRASLDTAFPEPRLSGADMTRPNHSSTQGRESRSFEQSSRQDRRVQGNGSVHRESHAAGSALIDRSETSTDIKAKEPPLPNTESTPQTNGSGRINPVTGFTTLLGLRKSSVTGLYERTAEQPSSRPEACPSMPSKKRPRESDQCSDTVKRKRVEACRDGGRSSAISGQASSRSMSRPDNSFQRKDAADTKPDRTTRDKVWDLTQKTPEKGVEIILLSSSDEQESQKLPAFRKYITKHHSEGTKDKMTDSSSVAVPKTMTAHMAASEPVMSPKKQARGDSARLSETKDTAQAYTDSQSSATGPKSSRISDPRHGTNTKSKKKSRQTPGEFTPSNSALRQSRDEDLVKDMVEGTARTSGVNGQVRSGANDSNLSTDTANKARPTQRKVESQVHVPPGTRVGLHKHGHKMERNITAGTKSTTARTETEAAGQKLTGHISSESMRPGSGKVEAPSVHESKSSAAQLGSPVTRNSDRKLEGDRSAPLASRAKSPTKEKGLPAASSSHEPPKVSNMNKQSGMLGAAADLYAFQGASSLAGSVQKSPKSLRGLDSEPPISAGERPQGPKITDDEKRFKSVPASLHEEDARNDRFTQPKIAQELHTPQTTAAIPASTEAEITREENKHASHQQPSEQSVVLGDPAKALPIAKDSSGPNALIAVPRAKDVLEGHLQESRRRRVRANRDALTKARLSRAERTVGHLPDIATEELAAAEDTEKPYCWKSLRPIPLRAHDKGVVDKTSIMLEVEKKGAVGKLKKSKYAVAVTRLEPVDEMPAYAHYVSVKSNYLAPNAPILHYWPYFEDEFDYEKERDLNVYYNLDITERKRKLNRLHAAQALEGAAELALRDLNITWDDVLKFLLDPLPDVGQDLDAKLALERRELSCKEDFDRDHERSVTVLSSLASSNSSRLARAAVLCESFLRMAKISLWHVARTHQVSYLAKRDKSEDKADFDENLTCRICLRFNCPYHGELHDCGVDDDDDSSNSKPSAVAVDIINPPEVNHRTRIAFKPRITTTVDDVDWTHKKDMQNVASWHSNYVYKPEELSPFYPCHHPGESCDQADCSCYENKLPCEKSCSCPTTCERKFQGCSCASGKLKGRRRIMCFEDERCVCWSMHRECDPDLCGSCGVCEVLDPVHRYDDEVRKERCKNASIQRGVPSRTLVGTSAIHGFGLFAGEDLGTHDFISEYKGEIITRDEAERRAVVYDVQKLSYLFSLNAAQDIDSTYFGNKIRFVNHTSSKKANLYPRIFTVNTVQRIAMFASRRIKAGEELFFDYGPHFPDVQLGGQELEASKSVPHVRNAQPLLAEGYDARFEEDDDGTRRARKGAKLRSPPQKADTGKGKAVVVNEHDGARPLGRQKSAKSAQAAEDSAGSNEEWSDSDVPRDGASGMVDDFEDEMGDGQLNDIYDLDEAEDDEDYQAEREARQPRRSQPARSRRQGSSMARKGYFA